MNCDRCDRSLPGCSGMTNSAIRILQSPASNTRTRRPAARKSHKSQQRAHPTQCAHLKVLKSCRILQANFRLHTHVRATRATNLSISEQQRLAQTVFSLLMALCLRMGDTSDSLEAAPTAARAYRCKLLPCTLMTRV